MLIEFVPVRLRISRAETAIEEMERREREMSQHDDVKTRESARGETHRSCPEA